MSASVTIAASGESVRACRPTRGTPATVMRDLRRTAARAVGCPATAPSAEALGLAWRLRADAYLLAATIASASGDPTLRAESPRLRRVGQAWTCGASRLRDCTDRRAAWLELHFGRSAALPLVGPAYGIMQAEMAVWRLARRLRRIGVASGGVA